MIKRANKVMKGGNRPGRKNKLSLTDSKAVKSEFLLHSQEYSECLKLSRIIFCMNICPIKFKWLLHAVSDSDEMNKKILFVKVSRTNDKDNFGNRK